MYQLKNSLLRYIPLFVILIMTVVLLVGCAEWQKKIPIAKPSTKATTSPKPTSVLTPTPIPSPEPEQPFIAAHYGEVRTMGPFSKPLITVFFLIGNATARPQAMLRADAVLFDERERQLGTRSWGSRPLILAPEMKLPLAFTFEGSEWSRVTVSVSKTQYAASHSVYRELTVTGSQILRDSKGAKASGTIANTGSATAIDITAIILGYNQNKELVSWGYAYPAQVPFYPGKTLTFESNYLEGDNSPIASHQVLLFGHTASDS